MSKLIKIDNEYAQWIKELSERFRASQIKAAVSVNREMLRYYWSIGRDIVARDAENYYGAGFYKNLSEDLKAALPGVKGLSEKNLQYMKRIYSLYSQSFEIVNKLLTISKARIAHKLWVICQRSYQPQSVLIVNNLLTILKRLSAQSLGGIIVELSISFPRTLRLHYSTSVRLWKMVGLAESLRCLSKKDYIKLRAKPSQISPVFSLLFKVTLHRQLRRIPTPSISWN